MSRDRMAVQPGPYVLEGMRIVARLTRRELWLRYLGLGGDSSPSEVDAFLEETREAPRREYNLLVDAVNEGLMDAGLFDRLAYAT